MNVIVSNKYEAMLTNLSIDLIKSISGEFEIEDLISSFDNFFFNKMVLDITAVKGYESIETIQKLSFNFDMSKVILLLDDSPKVNSPSYLSQLVSMGIYNFTRNIDTISYLIDNPNSYKDVAQFQQLTSSISDSDGAGSSDKFINSNMIMKGIGGTRVIGFKNITEHAGCSTLIYMLKKQVEFEFKVLAVEVDKTDFMFFNDSDLRSVSTKELPMILKNPSNNYDVIFVDINNSEEEVNLSEIVYLIEPTTIKLNKMIRVERNIFDRLVDKKIVLNQSLLNEIDVKDFENEAKCKIFFNMPPLDDKRDAHMVITDFLAKLGFSKSEDPNAKKKPLFGIVKE